MCCHGRSPGPREELHCPARYVYPKKKRRKTVILLSLDAWNHPGAHMFPFNAHPPIPTYPQLVLSFNNFFPSPSVVPSARFSPTSHATSSLLV